MAIPEVDENHKRIVRAFKHPAFLLLVALPDEVVVEQGGVIQLPVRIAINRLAPGCLPDRRLPTYPAAMPREDDFGGQVRGREPSPEGERPTDAAEPKASDWREFALPEGLAADPAYADSFMFCPRRFLQQLFAIMCDATEFSERVSEELVVPFEKRVVTGFTGTSQVGYRWWTRKCLETSSFPLEIAVSTYGLPGIDLEWSYRLGYAGQAGHAHYQHVSLRVRFASPSAERFFVNFWREKIAEKID